MPKMTGSRFFAEAMRGYGVTNVFYMNSVAKNALEEMGKLGVKTQNRLLAIREIPLPVTGHRSPVTD